MSEPHEVQIRYLPHTDNLFSIELTMSEACEAIMLQYNGHKLLSYMRECNVSAARGNDRCTYYLYTDKEGLALNCVSRIRKALTSDVAKVRQRLHGFEINLLTIMREVL